MTEQEKKEKVIKGLECCGYSRFMDKCQECPYDGKDCFKRLKTDALALLKARETIVSIRPIRCSAHAQGADDVWYECGGCGEFLGVNRYSKQFCSKCGKAVRW